jgi:hypothetical protein
VTLPDLIFLASFVFCTVMVFRLVWLAIRGRWRSWRVSAWLLTGYLAVYVTALIVFALLTPRVELRPGEPKCYDDWCIAATGVHFVRVSPDCPGAADVWVATLNVRSVAIRVRQRAADAAVEMEDPSGRHYLPCGSGGSHSLRGSLEPRESFLVFLEFALPAHVRPAGLVVSHGAFPGRIIVGDDQSWLHKPTLFHLSVY